MEIALTVAVWVLCLIVVCVIGLVGSCINDKNALRAENETINASLQIRDNSIASLVTEVEMYEGRYKAVCGQLEDAEKERDQIRETLRRINSLTLSHEDIREYSEQVNSLREAATTIKQVRKSLEKDIEQIEADVA